METVRADDARIAGRVPVRTIRKTACLERLVTRLIVLERDMVDLHEWSLVRLHAGEAKRHVQAGLEDQRRHLSGLEGSAREIQSSPAARSAEPLYARIPMAGFVPDTRILGLLLESGREKAAAYRRAADAACAARGLWRGFDRTEQETTAYCDRLAGFLDER